MLKPQYLFHKVIQFNQSLAQLFYPLQLHLHLLHQLLHNLH